MDVRVSQNPVVLAIRQKAAAEDRAIICYPFSDGGGRLQYTIAGRCLVVPAGAVYRMSEIVLTVHGTAAIVGMAPSRKYRGGTVVKLRIDKTGEVVCCDYTQFRKLEAAS